MRNEVRERINASSMIEARRNRLEAGGRAMLERAKENPFYGYIDIAIPGHGEVTLFSNNDDYVAMEYFWSGSYEPMSLSLWAQLCASKPPVIMDIGAYTGLFGLIAAKVSPQSQVVCVEPIDRIYSRIMINKKVNEAPKIEIVKGVASDQPGFAHLSISVGNDILPTGTSVRTAESELTVETFDIQAHVVDDLLGRHPDRRCGIMKIDAERHEISVLNGARNSIRRWRPDILIEILDRDIYTGVFDFLRSLGGDYKSFQIDDATMDVQLNDGSGFAKGQGRNFLLSARPIEAVENDIRNARQNLASMAAQGEPAVVSTLSSGI